MGCRIGLWQAGGRSGAWRRTARRRSGLCPGQQILQPLVLLGQALTLFGKPLVLGDQLIQLVLHLPADQSEGDFLGQFLLASQDALANHVVLLRTRAQTKELLKVKDGGGGIAFLAFVEQAEPVMGGTGSRVDLECAMVGLDGSRVVIAKLSISALNEMRLLFLVKRAVG